MLLQKHLLVVHAHKRAQYTTHVCMYVCVHMQLGLITKNAIANALDALKDKIIFKSKKRKMMMRIMRK